MRIITHIQLKGDYGLKAPGDEFECPDELALRLIKEGKAHRAGVPKILYETKVIVPEAPEVGPGPFRDRAVLDAKSTEMAATSDTGLPESDVSKQETFSLSRRRGRPRNSDR